MGLKRDRVWKSRKLNQRGKGSDLSFAGRIVAFKLDEMGWEGGSIKGARRWFPFEQDKALCGE